MEEIKRTNYKRFKIFLLIFIALSLFFLQENNRDKIMSLLDSYMGKEKVLRLKHSIQDIDDIEDVSFYDGNIVVWSTNKITFLKSDGSLVLEKQFEFLDPQIHFGNNIYVFDKIMGDVYSLNSKGETTSRLELNKELYNIKESYDNFYYHVKLPNMESISLLDKDKVLIGNYLYEDKPVLAYKTNKDGSKSLIGILNLNEKGLKSQIDLYGINNEKLNTLDFEGEIILYLDFTLNDEIILLTDRKLYFINDGKVLWKKQFDLIKDIYLNKEKIYVLYSNYLETIDFSGRTQNKIGFTEEYDKILPFKEKILLYSDNHLAILDDGKEIAKHVEEITKVCVNKNEILILGPEGIKIYELSNK